MSSYASGAQQATRHSVFQSQDFSRFFRYRKSAISTILNHAIFYRIGLNENAAMSNLLGVSH
jgi:hypothetical protein